MGVKRSDSIAQSRSRRSTAGKRKHWPGSQYSDEEDNKEAKEESDEDKAKKQVETVPGKEEAKTHTEKKPEVKQEDDQEDEEAEEDEAAMEDRERIAYARGDIEEQANSAAASAPMKQ